MTNADVGRRRAPSAPPWPRRVTARPSTWIAVGLLVACIGMVAFTLTSVLLPDSAALPNRPDLATFIVVCFAFVALPSVGALLAIRRPGNPIGWLFLACGTGFILAIFATEYVDRHIILDANLPAIVLVDWMGTWSLTLSVSLAVLGIPLLFPDGHVPGPRWRPLAWASAVLLMVGGVALALVDTSHGYVGRLPNPVGIGGSAGDVAKLVTDVYLPAVVVLGLLSIASLISRFRYARDAERQQIKWLLFAGVFLISAIVIALATTLEAAWYAVFVGLALLPVAAGVAILRYRLYEIDRLVSRSIAYTIVTVGLVLVYLIVNLGLTTAFSSAIDVDSVAVAASTLVVAALFTPIRRRVQRAVDRRFDRARYDAERTAVAFSERLRNQVDLPTLADDLDATIRRSIAPRSVALWIREGLR